MVQKTMVEVTGSLQAGGVGAALSYAGITEAPFNSIEVRVVPENVTNLQRAEPNATSFYDAVSLSLITGPVAGRRQLTIVLSDADDNSSFFDQATLVDTGRRTDAVVYAVLPDATGRRRYPAQEKMLKDRLSVLTTLTGGRVIAEDKNVTAAFLNALEDFRKSYVVAYTATGVNTAAGTTESDRAEVPVTPCAKQVLSGDGARGLIVVVRDRLDRVAVASARAAAGRKDDGVRSRRPSLPRPSARRPSRPLSFMGVIGPIKISSERWLPAEQWRRGSGVRERKPNDSNLRHNRVSTRRNAGLSTDNRPTHK
jgi:hypothetical protein